MLIFDNVTAVNRPNQSSKCGEIGVSEVYVLSCNTPTVFISIRDFTRRNKTYDRVVSASTLSICTYLYAKCSFFWWASRHIRKTWSMMIFHFGRGKACVLFPRKPLLPLPVSLWNNKGVLELYASYVYSRTIFEVSMQRASNDDFNHTKYSNR